MNVGGPESGFLVLRAADCAEIRGERIEPDIKNVRLFAGNGNAPANRSARDAEIAEAAFDEAEHFVAAGFGLGEIGMLGVPIEQRLLKSRKFEKIIFFGDSFGWAAAIAAGLARPPVHVSIVGDAVLPR